jgi:hypothetical protein
MKELFLYLFHSILLFKNIQGDSLCFTVHTTIKWLMTITELNK